VVKTEIWSENCCNRFFPCVIGIEQVC